MHKIMKKVMYRGYKIEESPRKDGSWNVSAQYPKMNGGKGWHWLWAYGSLEEAKEEIDKHLSYIHLAFTNMIVNRTEMEG